MNEGHLRYRPESDKTELNHLVTSTGGNLVRLVYFKNGSKRSTLYFNF